MELPRALRSILPENFIENKSFDAWALAFIDFRSGRVVGAQSFQRQIKPLCNKVFFDLASLTKPLTLGLLKHAYSSEFDLELDALIEHRAGIPAWGRLAKESWKQLVYQLPAQKNNTLYSDLSFLKAQLLLEEKTGKTLKELISPYLSSTVFFWQDVKDKSRCPITGQRKGENIQGEVHDDNAFYLKTELSHAGLFSTAIGLADFLLSFNQKFDLLETQKSRETDYRFFQAWDSPSGELTLAGNKVGGAGFGHLGFTGTSIWIDPDRLMGQILLTNTTRYHWYEKRHLNQIRREIGNFGWTMFDQNGWDYFADVFESLRAWPNEKS